MTTVSMKEAKNRLSELARRVEAGETVVVTRNGKPVMELVAPKRRGGIDWKAGREFKRKHGIDSFFGPIPTDFDDPLPEDFLISPLPK